MQQAIPIGSIKKEKFLVALAEKAEGGVVKSPSQFWRNAGYQDRASCQGVLGYLRKEGFLEKVEGERASYKLLYFLSEDKKSILMLERAEKSTAEGTCVITPVAPCPYLILNPEEKRAFDALNNSHPHLEDRIRESDEPFINLIADLKDSFIQKMCKCGVLEFVGQGKKGRIFRFHTEVYLNLCDKVEVMIPPANLLEILVPRHSQEKTLLEKLQSEEQAYSAKFKETSSEIEGVRKQLAEIEAKLKRLTDEDEKNRQRLEEVRTSLSSGGYQAKVGELQTQILALEAISKLSEKQQLDLLKQIFPKEEK